MRRENKQAIQKELQSIGSTLGDQEKRSGFQVPDGYFEGLHAAVQDRISRGKQRDRVFWGIPAVYYRKVVPVLAAFALVIAIGVGLFLQQGNHVLDQYAADDILAEWEYMAAQSEHDRLFLYDVVSESDLSAEEIYYGLEAMAQNGELIPDELMESLFEQAQYFGIDNRYLLSSLD